MKLLTFFILFSFGTIAYALDSDGDGLSDEQEVAAGLDPNDAGDYMLDSDGDGIYNGDEVQDGTDHTDSLDYIPALNTNFGNAGVFKLDFPGNFYYENYIESLYADGDKLYALGSLGGEEDSAILFKLDETGTVDTNFGVDGYFIDETLGIYGYGKSINKLQNNSFLASITYPDIARNTILVALTSDGELDTSLFSGETTPGIYPIPESARSAGAASVQTSNGDIYVLSSNFDSNSASYVYKLSSSGELDSSFNADSGVLSVQANSSSEYPAQLLALADGNLMAFVRASSAPRMFKFTPEGSLDTSFGSSGIYTPSNAGTLGTVQLRQLSDGRLAMLCYILSNTAGGVQLQVMDTDGNLDSSFADAGVFTLSDDEDNQYDPIGLFENPDGSIAIVIEHESVDTQKISAMVAVINADGSYNTAYSEDGIYRQIIGEDISFTNAAMTADGGYSLGGYYDISGVGYEFIVVKIAGTIDESSVATSSSSGSSATSPLFLFTVLLLFLHYRKYHRPKILQMN